MQWTPTIEQHIHILAAHGFVGSWCMVLVRWRWLENWGVLVNLWLILIKKLLKVKKKKKKKTKQRNTEASSLIRLLIMSRAVLCSLFIVQSASSSCHCHQHSKAMGGRGFVA
jgi:hypothetical protein